MDVSQWRWRGECRECCSRYYHPLDHMVSSLPSYFTWQNIYRLSCTHTLTCTKHMNRIFTCTHTTHTLSHAQNTYTSVHIIHTYTHMHTYSTLTCTKPQIHSVVRSSKLLYIQVYDYFALQVCFQLWLH